MSRAATRASAGRQRGALTRGPPPGAPPRSGRRRSPSARSSTHTRPPWRFTCSATRASPRPTPSLLPRRPAPRAAGEAVEDQARGPPRARRGRASSTAIWMPSSDSAAATRSVAPPPYLLGVVEQVGDHPHDAPLVGLDHHAGQLGVELDGHVGVGGVADGLHHELGEVHLLELEAGHAGVEAGDLEQVLDELLEAVDVGHHQVEGRAGPARGARRAGCSAPRSTRPGSSAGSAARG